MRNSAPRKSAPRILLPLPKQPGTCACPTCDANIAKVHAALRDLLDIYDRHVHGKTGPNKKASESWGIPEVLRLNEIRALAGVK